MRYSTTKRKGFIHIFNVSFKKYLIALSYKDKEYQYEDYKL